jgi:hypothetical protein
MPLSMININCAAATNFPRSRCDVAPYAPADCHGDNVAALERWNTVINHRVLSGFSQYTGPHEDTMVPNPYRFGTFDYAPSGAIWRLMSRSPSCRSPSCQPPSCRAKAAPGMATATAVANAAQTNKRFMIVPPRPDHIRRRSFPMNRHKHEMTFAIRFFFNAAKRN